MLIPVVYTHRANFSGLVWFVVSDHFPAEDLTNEKPPLCRWWFGALFLRPLQDDLIIIMQVEKTDTALLPESNCTFRVS